MPKSNKKRKQSDKESKLTLLDIARLIKDILQGFIALGIVILLAAKLGYHIDRSLNDKFFDALPYLRDILRLPALDLVAKALAYSAGVALAYMLLTPGPDEAIEPLILGLASAILFSISSIGETHPTPAWEIGLYVVILSFLFLMKALFIPPEADKPYRRLIAELKVSFNSLVEKWQELNK